MSFNLRDCVWPGWFAQPEARRRLHCEPHVKACSQHSQGNDADGGTADDGKDGKQVVQCVRGLRSFNDGAQNYPRSTKKRRRVGKGCLCRSSFWTICCVCTLPVTSTDVGESESDEVLLGWSKNHSRRADFAVLAVDGSRCKSVVERIRQLRFSRRWNSARQPVPSSSERG